MTRQFNIARRAALSIAACLVLASPAARADAPVVNITAPTGTVFSNTFPFTQSVTFTISHAGLDDLNVLDVMVGSDSLFNAPVGNPFSTTGCNAQLSAVSTTCTTQTNNMATVTVPWVVQGTGAYPITVSLKHRSAEGIDVETVAVMTLSAEYPAPPAIANAHINANTYLKTLSGKRRGCVISKIAELHSQNSEYFGPKGGPYNDGLVRSHVESFVTSCGG